MSSEPSWQNRCQMEKVAQGVGYQAAVNMEQHCGCSGRKVEAWAQGTLPGPLVAPFTL